jgi:hypothetical protein
MIDAMMLLAPCAKMLAVLAIIRLGWVALGDVILEHVGIPFLDAGWRRDEVQRPAGVCVRLSSPRPSRPDVPARRAA